MITREQLAVLAPRPASGTRARIWDDYADAIVSDEGHAVMAGFGIVTGPDVCHFLANVAHETGGFTVVAESGAYSAKRISEVFGVGKHSAKVTQAEAKVIGAMSMAPAHAPKRAIELFERVYGLGNPKKARELGNTEPGDGWRYRGRGPMQVTGRDAYARSERQLDLPLVEHPELLEEPVNGLKAAAFVWREKGCSRWAREDNARMVRRLINGGYNGMADVEAYLIWAKKLWWDIETVVASETRAQVASETRAQVASETRAQVASETRAQVASETRAQVASETHLSSGPHGRPLLKPGDEGEWVRVLQTELNRLGYWAGEIDGDFGPRTIEALAAFKADPRHDPPLDRHDNVDADVWAALAVAKPRDMGPRATITADELATRSRTVGIFSRIESMGRWAYRTVLAFIGVDVGAQTAGIDLIETVAIRAERITSLFGKLNLPTGFASPRIALLAGLIVLAVVGWMIARRARGGIESKVADVRAGAALGTPAGPIA